jgi:hypothetical protein
LSDIFCQVSGATTIKEKQNKKNFNQGDTIDTFFENCKRDTEELNMNLRCQTKTISGDHLIVDKKILKQNQSLIIFGRKRQVSHTIIPTQI